MNTEQATAKWPTTTPIATADKRSLNGGIECTVVIALDMADSRVYVIHDAGRYYCRCATGDPATHFDARAAFPAVAEAAKHNGLENVQQV